MQAHMEWTDSARERLEHYLDKRQHEAGEDPDARRELREDLGLHVQEELLQVGEGPVTLSRLEAVLAKLGPEEEARPEHARHPEPLKRSTWKTSTLWLFGVILPAGVFGLEYLTTFCGSVFFSPLESWVHILLVALVIATNAWFLSPQSGVLPLKTRAVLSGIVLTTSGFYALLFVPLLLLSVLALVVYGMGMLSLAPIFAFFATRDITRRPTGHGLPEWKKFRRYGSVATLVVLLVLQAPSLWTRAGLARALSSDEKTSESGISRLRFFHDEKTLLRACYEGNRGTTMSTDISGWLMDSWQLLVPFLWEDNFRDFNSEEVREIFYRATGKPFNSLKPPRFVAEGGGLFRSSDSWDDVQWDDHRGEDQVAVRLRNLDLHESRMDGHVDAASGLAYLEWTFVFQNDAPVAQEARMQLLLPRDGVVSRLTLWVNDEPREAAFASKGKVREAYQSVAVKQNRDPVLVTASGPDRVLVQCYPVPANGGLMKIRLGITAPLIDGQAALPTIQERNFGIAESLESPVWLQGPEALALGKQASHADGPGQSLQSKMTLREVDGHPRTIVCQSPPVGEVWCEDQFAEAGQELLQRELVDSPVETLDKCFVVVDGSRSLASHKAWLEKALGSLGDRFEIVIADDGVGRDLAAHRFTGGRDNGPALEWAIREAKSFEHSAIIWVHGPQPVEGKVTESISQLLERGWNETPLYSIALEPGGNRMLETLFKYRSVQTGPRDRERILPWLKKLADGKSGPRASWSRYPAGTPMKGEKVWDQLARHWASEKVREASRVQNFDSSKVAFASRYQLVTAWSGAVVLETAEQFQQHGLQPVDVSTVPDIPATPEPGVAILLFLSTLLAMARRRRS